MTEGQKIQRRVKTLGERTYDLAYLQAIHRQFFQDVYEWAGDLRTVGIEKGSEYFCPPGSITRPMDHVATEIHRLRQLRDVPDDDLPRTAAYLYDCVNFAHPFREGNGRATREFFDLLLSERGTGLDWEKTDHTELYTACHVRYARCRTTPVRSTQCTGATSNERSARPVARGRTRQRSRRTRCRVRRWHAW